MRIKLIILAMMPVLLFGCQSSIWTKITMKKSKLYTETEKIILHEAADSVNFKYGYDPDLEMDYVFKAGTFSEKEISDKSPEMKKILQKHKTAEVIAFYEKIVQLKETQVWKMNLFRENRKWADSTYIQKYILPETELFLNILEKNVVQIDTAYGTDIEKRKSEIKKMTAAILKKELEDRERERSKNERY